MATTLTDEESEPPLVFLITISVRRSQIYAGKNTFLMQNKPLSHNCSNPLYLLCIKKVHILMTKCILVKGFKLSVLLSLTLSLMSGCEVDWPWWVTSKEVSSSSLPTSVSGCITSFTSFPLLHACGTSHISQLSITSQKTTQKTWTCFFSIVMKPVASTISEPVDSRLPTEEGIQT